MTCWYRPVPQGREVEDPGAGTQDPGAGTQDPGAGTQDLEEEQHLIGEGGGRTEEGQEQTTGGAAGLGIYSTHFWLWRSQIQSKLNADCL